MGDIMSLVESMKAMVESMNETLTNFSALISQIEGLVIREHDELRVVVENGETMASGGICKAVPLLTVDDDDYELVYPPRPPKVSNVHHSSSTPQGDGCYIHPNTTVTHHDHFPTFNPHKSSHETGSGTGGRFDLYNKPSYKVYCKAAPDFNLTIRDGKVVLALSDPADQCQNWFKYEQGYPSFLLVNKALGQSMKHAPGHGLPVELVPYDPEALDETVLWTLSRDLGDGYKAMRMVNNIHLNVDAFEGIKEFGGVHDGTTVGLWDWNKGDNQLWKVVPDPRCT